MSAVSDWLTCIVVKARVFKVLPVSVCLVKEKNNNLKPIKQFCSAIIKHDLHDKESIKSSSLTIKFTAEKNNHALAGVTFSTYCPKC